MPLAMAQTGKETVVKEIRGRDETKRFLASLGFVEGSSIVVVSEMGGSLIVNVKDTRVALSKGMAGKIMVQGGIS
ncbi:FeoA family protein [Yanshouia hominis]|uniref:Ferrous iron transport protein A n=1 Tax=Yanshouia hominis TaxID=2763673 RepID=A0ABR7NG25_9FIRM|nr:FeoA family protein [Yanshouia hominis]MBC8575358.1 ferrous iron transport protein A [Yanshouia hominis]